MASHRRHCLRVLGLLSAVTDSGAVVYVPSKAADINDTPSLQLGEAARRSVDGPATTDGFAEAFADDVWSKMRHLYPYAPVRRPRDVAELLGTGTPFEMDGDIEDDLDIEQANASRASNRVRKINPRGLGAAAVCQQACSAHFVSGRPWDDVLTEEVWTWERAYQAKENSTRITLDGQSVKCLHDSYRATYAYTGKWFGCVHTDHIDTYNRCPAPHWQNKDVDGMKSHDAFSSALSSLEKLTPVDAKLSVDNHNSADIPQVIKDFVDAAFHSSTKSLGVGVYYKGNVLELYNSSFGVNKNTRLNGWSMAKSILSLLIGIRENEGELNVTAFVKAPEIDSFGKIRRGLSVENILNMRVGRTFVEEDTSSMLYGVPNTASWAVIGSEDKYSDGDHDWHYSSGMSNVNSRELRYSFPDDNAGFSEYAAYPWNALFSKINALSFTCEPDLAGTFIFSSSCYATMQDWLKLGLLVLHGGRNLKGEQVVPEEWVNHTTSYDFEDNGNHYTHGWYRLDRLYGYNMPIIAMEGIYGQRLIIVPSKDLIIVRFGLADSNLIQDWKRGGGPFADLIQALHEEGEEWPFDGAMNWTLNWTVYPHH